MKRLVVWTTAVGAALLLALTLAAQERRDSEQDKVKQKARESTTREATPQAGREQGRDQARGRQHDIQLAIWLATENEGEIELGKFAVQRAQSDEVKKFAQQMVDNHTQILKKLQQMAPLASAAPTAPGKATRPEDEKRQTTKPNEPGKRLTQTDPARPGEDTIRRGYLDPEGRIDLVKIKQEIAQQCVQTLKKELGEKSSAEFDKCYMGQQILAHLEMADTLKVMKNYVSPELREVIAEGEKSVQDHLADAKDIMKGLEGQSAKKDTRQDK